MMKTKTVKKILSITGIVLLALIALIFVLFTVFGNKAIKLGIEAGATSALKVGVTVEDVNLSLLGGKFELTGLKIENPAGYKHTEFLTIDKVLVKLKTASLFSNTIEIEKIQIDAIQLTIEQKDLLTNNLKEILNSLPKSEETTETAKTETASATEEKAGKKLLIRELNINGIDVKIKLLPIPGKADTIPLKLNPIVLKDLGSDKPINTAELTAKVLQAIAGGIVEQGKNIGEIPVELISSIGSGLTESGKKILEVGAETTGTILKGAENVGKGATDALKGLFQKKEK